MTDKKKKAVSIAALALFFLLMLYFGWRLGMPMLHLMMEPESFRLWVDSFGIWGRLVFLGLVVFQVLVAFVPGEPVELAAGYIFGVLEGSLLTMAGFLLGSLLIFQLVRRFGVKLVKVFFTEEQIRQVGFLKNPRKTGILALILMTIPGTPKDFLSYFAGLTPMTLPQWLAIVSVSRLPSLLTSTVSGAAAGEENYLLSAIVLAVTAGISLVGVAWYRCICKQEREKE